MINLILNRYIKIFLLAYMILLLINNNMFSKDYYIDLGEIDPKNKIEKKITLKNETKAQLIITNIISPDKNISADILKSNFVKIKNNKFFIAPYSKFLLKVIINFPVSRIGKIEKNIYLKGRYRNGLPYNKKIILSIKIKKKHKFELRTLSMSFKRMDDKDFQCKIHNSIKFFLTVLYDKNFPVDITDDFIEKLNKIFENNLYVRKIDYKLYDKFKELPELVNSNHRVLPVYIFDKEIEKSSLFIDWIKNKKLIKTKFNEYIINPSVYTEKVFYLDNNRRKNKREINIFIRPYSSSTIELINNLLSPLQDKNMTEKININFYYIAGIRNEKNKNNFSIKDFYSINGKDEILEEIRGVLIKKYYPDKYFLYLYYRSKDYKNKKWLEWIYNYLGINKKKIEDNITKREGAHLLWENIQFSLKYKILQDPTIMYNDIKYTFLTHSIKKLKSMLFFINESNYNLISK